MKIKELKELRTKTIMELKGLERTLRDEVLQLNLEKSQNKLKNTRQIFWKKKDIAKILTILKEKEFEVLKK